MPRPTLVQQLEPQERWRVRTHAVKIGAGSGHLAAFWERSGGLGHIGVRVKRASAPFSHLNLVIANIQDLLKRLYRLLGLQDALFLDEKEKRRREAFSVEANLKSRTFAHSRMIHCVPTTLTIWSRLLRKPSCHFENLPALILHSSRPQATFSVPFNPSLTGTTFVMSPEHPLPAELRRMQRSGASLPMDKFTPDKVGKIVVTDR